ncbi:outer membrane lipoprotein-sorting protein [bacterium]|nr:outer membrane lipoprotein-sorting protein [bacterium]
MLRFLLTIFLTLTSLVASAQTPTGLDIIQKQDAVNKGFVDEKGTGKMIIKGQGGDEAVREFEYQSLEETASAGRKALLKITQPANLSGTGLLTYENKGRDDDQWIYLPALKKSNRIVGGAKKGSFIGSDFTYEDMAPRSISDFTYTYVKAEPCGATNCSVIDSVPLPGTSIYSKVTLWVRDDNLQNARMDLYDDKGTLVKRATFDDYRQINAKFWRPYKIMMEDLNRKTFSTLVVESLALQTGLKDADFMTSVLER